MKHHILFFAALCGLLLAACTSPKAYLEDQVKSVNSECPMYNDNGVLIKSLELTDYALIMHIEENETDDWTVDDIDPEYVQFMKMDRLRDIKENDDLSMRVFYNMIQKGGYCYIHRYEGDRTGHYYELVITPDELAADAPEGDRIDDAVTMMNVGLPIWAEDSSYVLTHFSRDEEAIYQNYLYMDYDYPFSEAYDEEERENEKYFTIYQYQDGTMHYTMIESIELAVQEGMSYIVRNVGAHSLDTIDIVIEADEWDADYGWWDDSDDSF